MEIQFEQNSFQRSQTLGHATEAAKERAKKRNFAIQVMLEFDRCAHN